MHKAMVVALVLCVQTLAFAQWREDGKIVPDTAWQKAWGQHGAMLHITDKLDELFAAWEKPSPGVPISVTDTAKRGEPVAGIIIFTGCATDINGLCDSEVVFSVVRPSGELYQDPIRGELWQQKPPPEKGQLQLSIGAIVVKIEPEDSDGEYIIRARVMDNISGAEVTLESSFHVAEHEEEPGKD